MVVIPFRKVPFLVKTHAHRTDSLAQRCLFLSHLLLGSTSLPALTYASDRVTDVISVLSRQSLVQRVMSAVCLS